MKDCETESMVGKYWAKSAASMLDSAVASPACEASACSGGGANVAGLNVAMGLGGAAAAVGGIAVDAGGPAEGGAGPPAPEGADATNRLMRLALPLPRFPDVAAKGFTPGGTAASPEGASMPGSRGGPIVGSRVGPCASSSSSESGSTSGSFLRPKIDASMPGACLGLGGSLSLRWRESSSLPLDCMVDQNAALAADPSSSDAPSAAAEAGGGAEPAAPDASSSAEASTMGDADDALGSSGAMRPTDIAARWALR
mmetsp:Transcript_20688/g.79377  ORF Transcript_20688/g.79377 Transcript_20688/m.79377 type:complete len:255 (+) Transcript_20688:596-1360(+)